MRGESIPGGRDSWCKPGVFKAGEKAVVGQSALGKGKVAQCRGHVVQSPVWQGKEFEFILHTDRAQRFLECKLHEGNMETRDLHTLGRLLLRFGCQQLRICNKGWP